MYQDVKMLIVSCFESNQVLQQGNDLIDSGGLKEKRQCKGQIRRAKEVSSIERMVLRTRQRTDQQHRRGHMNNLLTALQMWCAWTASERPRFSRKEFVRNHEGWSADSFSS